MELINKADLIESLHREIYSDKSLWDGGMCWARYKDIIEVIENVDIVAERTKAKWGCFVTQKDFIVESVRQCTKCGGQPPADEYKRYKFCPFCGSEMEID